MVLTPECLVFVDVADEETEWIGQQHPVGNFVAEAVDDIRGPAFTPLFLLVDWRTKDFLKLDMGAIRRLAHVFKDDGVDLDIDIRRTGIEQESF
jgi:hypothetical protein